jgi:hypothetical protein
MRLHPSSPQLSILCSTSSQAFSFQDRLVVSSITFTVILFCRIKNNAYVVFSLFLFQRIPRWWIWYYWICPLAWTVYGLIVTQYGDLQDPITVPGESNQTISYYITHHFGYHRDFMPVVAPVLVLFAVFFAFMYAVCIKKLNFQQR